MPNARLENTLANVGIKKPIVNARVSSFQTGVLTPGTTTSVFAGTPIGLLLALTYPSDMVIVVTPPVYRGDQRPNVRITSF